MGLLLTADQSSENLYIFPVYCNSFNASCIYELKMPNFIYDFVKMLISNDHHRRVKVLLKRVYLNGYTSQGSTTLHNKSWKVYNLWLESWKVHNL